MEDALELFISFSLSLVLFFPGIVSDLFPGLVEKEMDYEILKASIRKSVKQMGLQDVNGEFYFLFYIIRNVY